MTDLSKTELKTYLDSTDMLGRVNERLHNELVKLPKDIGIPRLMKPLTCFGTNRAYQTSAKMQEEEEK